MKPMTSEEFNDRWAAHLFDHTTIQRIRAALEHREWLMEEVQRFVAARWSSDQCEAMRNLHALLKEGDA